MIFQDSRISNFDTIWVQLGCLVVFIVALLLSLRGIKFISKISSVAGISMFVMSLLYILLVWTAPVLTGTKLELVELKPENFIPQDPTVYLNISILIFAVGGCEKISPYVNQMRKPGKDFPMGMIFLAVMVMVCAILGSLAMGMMFDSSQMYDADYQSYFLAHGQYDAFAQLGEYYHVGNAFLIVYCACNAIGQFSVLIISIDAPLKIMLSNADKKFVPTWWFKTNKNGSYTNGLKVACAIVVVLLIIPCLGIPDVNSFIKMLIKLNSVCMPLRYLFVFAAYIGLKIHFNKFEKSEYTFVKNKTLGVIVGGWCFLVTLVSAIAGMYSTDTFTMVLNVATPIILLGIGLLLPAWAKRERKKAKA